MISIHAPHTGRDLFLLRSRHSSDISIHAPHPGRDLARLVLDTDKEQFQSTRPIRGATYRPKTLFSVLKIFQSTRPIRGATSLSGWNFIRHRNFNPRAPYGARPGASSCRAEDAKISIHAPHTGRDSLLSDVSSSPQISIHAPHTGRDYASSTGQLCRWLFQSTRPIRGATGHTAKRIPQGYKFQSTRPIRGATVLDKW